MIITTARTGPLHNAHAIENSGIIVTCYGLHCMRGGQTNVRIMNVIVYSVSGAWPATNKVPAHTATLREAQPEIKLNSVSIIRLPLDLYTQAVSRLLPLVGLVHLNS